MADAPARHRAVCLLPRPDVRSARFHQRPPGPTAPRPPVGSTGPAQRQPRAFRFQIRCRWSSRSLQALTSRGRHQKDRRHQSRPYPVSLAPWLPCIRVRYRRLNNVFDELSHRLRRRSRDSSRVVHADSSRQRCPRAAASAAPFKNSRRRFTKTDSISARSGRSFPVVLDVLYGAHQAHSSGVKRRPRARKDVGLQVDEA